MNFKLNLLSILCCAILSACSSEAILSEVAKSYEKALAFDIKQVGLPDTSIPIVTVENNVGRVYYQIDKSLTNADPRIDLDVFQNDGVTLHAIFESTGGGTADSENPNSTMDGNNLIIDITNELSTGVVTWKAGNQAGNQQLIARLYIQKTYVENGTPVEKKAFINGATRTFEILVEDKIQSTIGDITYDPFVIGHKSTTVGGPSQRQYWIKTLNYNLPSSLCNSNACTARFYTVDQANTIASTLSNASGNVHWVIPNQSDFNELKALVLVPEGLNFMGIARNGIYGGNQPNVNVNYSTDESNYQIMGLGSLSTYWANFNIADGNNAAYYTDNASTGTTNLPSSYGAGLVFKMQ